MFIIGNLYQKGESNMKKKLSAILLAMVFATSAMPITQAAPARADLQTNISVPADIEVKVGSDYVNGPATITTMSVANETASFKAEIDVTDVQDAIKDYKEYALSLGAIHEAELATVTVDGEFEIVIDYSNSVNEPTTTGDIVVPAEIIAKQDLSAFSTVDGKDLTKVFKWKSTDNNETEDKITIVVETVDNLKLETLESDFDNLVLTCDGIKFTEYGTYSIIGEVSGHTTIKSTSRDLATITYTFNQKPDDGDNKYADTHDKITDEISGTVKVNKPQSSDDDTPVSTVTPSKPTHTVTVDLDGHAENIEQKHKYGTELTADDFEIPAREGYKAELYLDKDFTQPVGDKITVDKDITIYVKWLPDGSESVLEADDHFAYVIGYPTKDGSEIVKPENNITREEIATIFYRLLKDDVRDVIFKATNSFDDVAADRWSNKAISTMANGEYIQGYPNGSFKPANAITRAEFVTVAARFFANDTIANSKIADFTDTADHWAAEYIRQAAASNWIDGYADGTFKPEQYITRAEVMKIINNMLNRHVTAEGLIEDAKTWDDNDANAWYYYDVIEATNPHTFERAEGETTETWTAIVENKVIIEKPEYEDAE